MPVLGFCNASEKIHFKLISVSPNYTVYFIISFAKSQLTNKNSVSNSLSLQ